MIPLQCGDWVVMVIACYPGGGGDVVGYARARSCLAGLALANPLYQFVDVLNCTNESVRLGDPLRD